METTTQTATQETPKVAPPATVTPQSTAPAATQTAAQVSTNEPKASEAATPPATAVPEKYELKMPEGSLLGSQAIERISAYAKQKGLSNQDAQSLLERESEAVNGYQSAQVQGHNELVDKWAKEVETDPDLGGENYKKNVELASRVIKKFGTPKLIEDLNKTGYGNYPELVRLFNKIGRAMSEDQLILPGSAPAPKKDIADVLYGGKKA